MEQNKNTDGSRNLYKKIAQSELIVGYLSSISFMIMIFAASYAVSDKGWRTFLYVAAAAIITVGLIYCVRTEQTVGFYVCPSCGEKYTPEFSAILLSRQKNGKRKLNCPHCGNRVYHRKVYSKD